MLARELPPPEVVTWDIPPLYEFLLVFDSRQTCFEAITSGGRLKAAFALTRAPRGSGETGALHGGGSRSV